MAKFCPECGFKQHGDDNRFCSNCGFDFSKLEELDVGLNIYDDSTVSVPITDLDDSNDSNSTNSQPITPVSKNSPITSNQSKSNSTVQRKHDSSNGDKAKAQSNDLLSKLTFNKCFLAFAVLLIFLLILGLIVESMETEPYSDNGLTSFMESSNRYDLNDFLEDSSYDDDYSDDYLKYGGDGDADIFSDN